MSIFTKIKQKVTQIMTDDDSHDKHNTKDSQHSDKSSVHDHHHDDHHHDDREHSHDKKNKKGKEDMFDFFD
jgi:hypothetical protein